LLEISSCTAIHWISGLNKSSGKISMDWRWLSLRCYFFLCKSAEHLFCCEIQIWLCMLVLCVLFFWGAFQRSH